MAGPLCNVMRKAANVRLCTARHSPTELILNSLADWRTFNNTDFYALPAQTTHKQPCACVRAAKACLPAMRAASAVANEATRWGTKKTNPVLCLHGMFVTRLNSLPMVAMLRRRGWLGAQAWGYASRSATIEEHAKSLVEELGRMQQTYPEQPLHFVTHSMGGLVLRLALAHPACPEEARQGKAVLIAPPLRGSEWARTVAATGGLAAALLLGEHAGRQLASHPSHWFEALPPFPRSKKLLIVAGISNTWNPFLRHAASDGTVLVSETALDSEHERVEVQAGHTLVQWSPDTMAAVAEFLERDIAADG